MAKIILILSLLTITITLLCAPVRSQDDMEVDTKVVPQGLLKRFKIFDFNRFMTTFGREYKNGIEKAIRRAVYLANTVKIFIQNILYSKKQSDYYLAVTPLADKTETEIHALYPALPRVSPDGGPLENLPTNNEQEPEEKTEAIDEETLERELTEIIEKREPGHELIEDALIDRMQKEMAHDRTKRSIGNGKKRGIDERDETKIETRRPRRRRRIPNELRDDKYQKPPRKVSFTVPDENPDFEMPMVMSQGVDDQTASSVPEEERSWIGSFIQTSGQWVHEKLKSLCSVVANSISSRDTDFQEPRDESPKRRRIIYTGETIGEFRRRLQNEDQYRAPVRPPIIDNQISEKKMIDLNEPKTIDVDREINNNRILHNRDIGPFGNVFDILYQRLYDSTKPVYPAPEEKKTGEIKPEEKKTGEIKPEEKKTGEIKPEEKQPEEKQPEEQQPEEKRRFIFRPYKPRVGPSDSNKRNPSTYDRPKGLVEVPDNNDEQVHEQLVDPIKWNIDWRQTKCFLPVRRQRDCGSCWAFATIANLEYQLCRQRDVLISLSEQYYVDCGPEFGGGRLGLNGCKGGQIENIHHLINHFGLLTQNDYPYTATQGTCPYDPVRTPKHKLGRVRPTVVMRNLWLGGSAIQHIDEMLLKGPVVSGLFLPKDFHLYGGGIHPMTSCNLEDGHAMLIVGSGVENGKSFWLYRNSHSSAWGEEGYFRMTKFIPSQCMHSLVNWDINF